MGSAAAVIVVLPALFAIISVVQGSGDDFVPSPLRPGPWVEATKGEVWPKPSHQVNGETLLALEPASFAFRVNDVAGGCPIIVQSLPRFLARLFPSNIKSAVRVPRSESDKQLDFLFGISVNLEDINGCEALPHMNMNESYALSIDSALPEGHYIAAPTVWGLLRGLESFTQLVHLSPDNVLTYQIRSTYIEDFPRFSHSGFMIDSSRHFLSRHSIYQTLDLMEMNKMNVLHWHMTDDASFPFQSQTFPELSNKGAFDPVSHVYSPEVVNEVINNATLRGIRVIPEFDTPGHTMSWERGVNGLLAQCYTSGAPDGNFGPMDPTKESVYTFLASFFTEVKNTFPDSYFHIGGDEVNTACWESNPDINAWMAQMNMTGQYRKLESYFIERVLEIVQSEAPNKASIVWQEVFDNGDQIDPDTLVHIWKNWGTGWKLELQAVTGAGQPALLSAPWYLNYITYGSDWVEMYNEDPHDFVGTQEAKNLVLGGEACIWGEFVNSINLIPRAWPRASAVAERLWSSLAVITDAHAAAPRMQEHECRMLERGYPVQPVVGAGYCPIDWDEV